MAQAQESRIYAQIQDGKIHWVFSKTDLPEWDGETFTAVDITDMRPTPQVGWLFDGSSFVEPPIDFNRLWELARMKRDYFLGQSDWTQLTDVQAIMPPERNAQWILYRQELRDITHKYADPRDIVWPIPPGSQGV